MKSIKQLTFILLITLPFQAIHSASNSNNEPNFESIFQREIPAWFNEDKFGIFIVWGPYAVPSFRIDGYAEWYWKHSQSNPESKAFHAKTYGEDFAYENFADQFRAELWDPDFWCDLIVASGAKYVATTANYHDGFAMWPTKYSKTKNTDRWNSMVRGPKRDILGELNEAGNKRGLKMGIYYSFYEWYHPLWLKDPDRFATEWLAPKFKEVVTKYKPWHIFLDGEWEMDYKRWKSEDLAHWLYNKSPIKDTVVVNDRWGQTRGIWGDVLESEYGGGRYSTPNHPWQEDRGIGKSYGYNRTESVYDYDSREELLRMFSGVVGGGGNFLLCVGPTGDGRIPVIMQERLLQIGDWLKVNGDAIYGSTASPFWPRQFDWGTVSKKPGKLYLHIHDPNLEELRITGINAKITAAKLLHRKGNKKVSFKHKRKTLRLNWPNYLNDQAVTIIELDVADGYELDKTPTQYASGIIEFNCWAMEVHGEKAYPLYSGYRNRLMMTDWTDPNEYLTSEFIVEKPGTFQVELIYASEKKAELSADSAQSGAGPDQPKSTVGGRFDLTLGDTILKLTIEDLGSARFPQTTKIGRVTFDKKGPYAFALKPVDDGNWNGFAFQGIRMTPIE